MWRGGSAIKSKHVCLFHQLMKEQIHSHYFIFYNLKKYFLVKLIYYIYFLHWLFIVFRSDFREVFVFFLCYLHEWSQLIYDVLHMWNPNLFWGIFPQLLFSPYMFIYVGVWNIHTFMVHVCVCMWVMYMYVCMCFLYIHTVTVMQTIKETATYSASVIIFYFCCFTLSLAKWCTLQTSTLGLLISHT